MKAAAVLAWLAICGLSLSACNSTGTVSYRRDVYPVLKENCLACHVRPSGKGYLAVGLSMESYESLMRGTIYGPVLIPGNSRRSILTMLVEGRADPSMRMPHQSDERLRPEEIATLRLWVDQGARNN